MGIFKKLFTAIFVCLLVCYLGLYLALPYILNKKDYSKILTENIKKQTGLILIVHDYKLSSAPNLDISLKAKDIQLFYPNRKQILNIKNTDINFSTLCLLKKEIKINKVMADEFQFSTKLLKNGKTTFQEYVEKNIKEERADFSFSKELPKIRVKKYIVKMKDEESGQKFKLSGNNFIVSQNLDFHYINFETKGALYCFDKKYINYNIKLAAPKVLFKDVNKRLIDISVDELYKYNLYADLAADIKIHEKDTKFTYLSGKVNIDNFTMKLGSNKLPPSFFHMNLDKGRAAVVSKFYTNKNEMADITANLKLTKPYDIDLKCVCPKAQIENLQKLSISVLQLLKIKNNLSEFKASGLISADFNIKTNLKTLHSKGNLKIINAKISHKSIPLNITGVNALIDFSNDTVKIKQSDILVNNQPVKVTGVVDSKAYGNILASAHNLDLYHIMNAFPFLKPQKNLIIKSGKLSFTAKIKGRLNDAVPQINAVISNFNAIEKTNGINLSVKETLIDAKTDKDKYSGTITLNDILCTAKAIPNASNSIKASVISAKFDNKDFVINSSKINLGNAKLTLSGDVKDYAKSPKFVINAGGTVDTALLMSFVPSEVKVFAKGYLPIKSVIKKEGNDTTISLNILSNPSNYITPIHINTFLKTNTMTNLDAKISGNNLVIDDASIYFANGINGLVKEVNRSKLKKAIWMKGKVLNYNSKPQLENVRIFIPENLNISIPGTKGGTAGLTADLLLNGNTEKPIVNGNINLNNLNVPEYFIKAQNASIIFTKSNINAKIDNLKIKDMDISLDALAPVDVITTNKINRVNLYAQYLDMDYLMTLMPLFAQAKYGPGTEFPYIISSGKLNVKSYKMGTLRASNVNADISSQKNILYLKNMFADAYGGKAAGKITYNFPYTSVHADIQGREMDAASAARDFMPKDQRISGRLNFDASIDMFGTTQEQQMITLKGRADILIKNGHLGPLGRFEHFLYAQNLLSQRLIYASLNSAKQAISPKDTGYVTYLKGMLKFSNGYAHLNPVLTAGPQMSMYITGSINLLNNYTDLQILGKVSSEVSSSMGLLGTMTIKDFLDEHTKYGTAAANLFNFCNTELPEMDISKIPALNPDYRYPTKNFRVLIVGDPESVTAVKSFTWVNPTGTKQKALSQMAKDAVKSVLPNQKSAPETPQTTPAVKEPVTQSRPIPEPPKQTGNSNFLDSIPDNFN